MPPGETVRWQVQYKTAMRLCSKAQAHVRLMLAFAHSSHNQRGIQEKKSAHMMCTHPKTPTYQQQKLARRQMSVIETLSRDSTVFIKVVRMGKRQSDTQTARGSTAAWVHMMYVHVLQAQQSHWYSTRPQLTWQDQEAPFQREECQSNWMTAVNRQANMEGNTRRHSFSECLFSFQSNTRQKHTNTWIQHNRQAWMNEERKRSSRSLKTEL